MAHFMTMPKTLDETSLATAARELAQRDGKLALSLEKYGVPPLWERPPGFATLVYIILEQQVSLASAKAAFARLEQTLGQVTPAAFLSLDNTALKAIGFSGQKMRYCRLLAEAIEEQHFIVEDLADLPDEKARAALTSFKGIGEWTANNYLLTALLRPDVWPAGDLALVVAWRDLQGSDTRPTQDELAKQATNWRPFRSVAARLLWNYYLKGSG
jgi:DNA-3-methyladenine glycosylase II